VTVGVTHYEGGDVGDIGTGDRRNAAVSCRAADHSRLVCEGGQQVCVEIVAKEGEFHPALSDRFFGIVMVAAEGERRIGSRPRERRVDEMPNSCGRGSPDERAVLLAPVGGLGRGHHEQHLDAAQRFHGGGLVGVLATAYPKAEVRCARGIADHQHGRVVRQ
jgi:hypothetical protein